MNTLQQLIPYELPSILQIHGKAVYGCPSIPTADIYVLTVKKRLLELGVNIYISIYTSWRGQLLICIVSKNPCRWIQRLESIRSQ